jgi:hypothetical protein
MKADYIIGALRKFLKALDHNNHELVPGERMFHLDITAWFTSLYFYFSKLERELLLPHFAPG